MPTIAMIVDITATAGEFTGRQKPKRPGRRGVS